MNIGRTISLITLAAALGLSQQAFAGQGLRISKQNDAGIFENSTPVRGHKLPDRAKPGKSRVVRIKKNILRHKSLVLNMGDGNTLEVVRERFAEHSGDRRAWIGRVKGKPESEVILTRAGRAMAGTIKVDGKLYKLMPVGRGEHVLSEVHADIPEIHDDPIAPPVVGGESTQSLSSGGGTVIDVMVVYTPAATAQYGSSDGVEALIALSIEETNQVYINSQVAASLRLVHTQEVNYTETSSMSTDLTNLAGKTDGNMDEIHALRDTYGADLVSLFSQNSSSCGTSYQLTMEHPAFEAYGFSSVYTGCATGYYSFAHELGHNMGVGHDAANADSAVIYSYSYGYQDPAGEFRTVMAYSNGCSGTCTRIPYFSNPYVDYNGTPTGIDGVADNARSLNNTVAFISTYRDSVQQVEVPFAPSNLTATVLSDTEIQLSWTDNADNEDGVRIERSSDGVSFTEIATLSADSTSYGDAGLSAETQYYYRVSAFNGGGDSDFSNDAWATTDPAPLTPPAAPSNLAASTVSEDSISLSWTDNASDEDGYRLERSLNGVDWTLAAALSAGASSHVDTGLSAETTYDYRVIATNGAMSSEASNVVSATTDPEPVLPPSDPNGLAATALSESQIDLTWNDNSANETGFEIERSDDGVTWSQIASLAAGSQSYSDTGLAAETLYDYRIRAIGDGGASGYSNVAQATTDAEPVSGPTCDITGASTLRLYSRSTYWTLTNNGSETSTITSVEISWPTTQGSLRKIRAGSSRTVYSTVVSGGYAFVDSWTNSVGYRELDAGEAMTLKFDFTTRYTKDSQSDYAITVNFADGCSVSF